MAQKRILLFPLPATGHIKPYLDLAKLLCDAGLHIIFLNTEYNHSRIENLEALTKIFPTLQFETIPDGLSPDRPRDILNLELIHSILKGTKPLLRRLIQSINDSSSSDFGEICCIISDPVMSAPVEVAEELGLPIYSFCILNACFLSTHFWMPNLLQQAQIPYADDNSLGEIDDVPVNEGVFRRKDLPGSVLWSAKYYTDENTPMFYINQTIQNRRTTGLIINTFDKLESPFLSYLSSIFKSIYTIGPIHALSKSKLSDSSVGLWMEDCKETTNIISWLNSKPMKSVIFISFGTISKFKHEELTEIWEGLVNTGRPFLFVLRSEMIINGEIGDEKFIEQLMGKTEINSNNRMIVKWSPQEKVLSHPAIGLFFTHAGWNSAMESIVAGVPMICRPVLGDQNVNANWIENVWKIGLEIKQECNRKTLEMMITTVLMEEKNEIQTSMEKFSKLANESVEEEGSSFQNLTKLVQQLKKFTCNH